MSIMFTQHIHTSHDMLEHPGTPNRPIPDSALLREIISTELDIALHALQRQKGISAPEESRQSSLCTYVLDRLEARCEEDSRPEMLDAWISEEIQAVLMAEGIIGEPDEFDGYSLCKTVHMISRFIFDKLIE